MAVGKKRQNFNSRYSLVTTAAPLAKILHKSCVSRLKRIVAVLVYNQSIRKWTVPQCHAYVDQEWTGGKKSQ